VEVASGGPLLPVGRRIELPGRGTTFVRYVEGPVNAPTLLLLHGWLASGGLNWFHTFEVLSKHFNLLAVDMRGHGRGIRSGRRFRLADCADDAAATLDALDIQSVIAVGYSLGGPVAQLLWRRHCDRVDGLVLCSTAHRLMPGVREQWFFGTLMAAAAGTTRVGRVATKVPVDRVRRLLPLAASSRPETPRATAAFQNRAPSMNSGTPRSWAIAATEATYETGRGWAIEWAWVFSIATRPVIGWWTSRASRKAPRMASRSIRPSGPSSSGRTAAPTTTA